MTDVSKRAFGALASLTLLAAANVMAQGDVAGTTANRFGGFSFEEAAQFVEFCVELDSQDDRRISEDAAFRPKEVPWQVLYDSRTAVAADILEWRRRGRPSGESDNPADLVHWAKLYRSAEATADSKGLPAASEQQIFDSPEINGFGPWNNSWILARSADPKTPDRYVIAIRGTIFSSSPSAVEDAFIQPVKARDFITRGFSFANDPEAVVHSGMAHGAYSLVLDSRYGVLAQLAQHNVSPGSRLYIVGHSQGAGLATLVHAVLGTMMRHADRGEPDPFDLRGMEWRLKSYAIAQPKIGNHVFASEFARHTQREDTAIVINNNLDPVPLVPLTFTQVADVGDVFTGKDRIAAWLHRAGNLGVFASGLFSRAAEPRIRDSAAGWGYYYKWDGDALVRVDGQYAWSWNYQSAGRVVYVFGGPSPDPADTFFQHHATTYRKLIAEQLGDSVDAGPAQSPQLPRTQPAAAVDAQ